MAGCYECPLNNTNCGEMGIGCGTSECIEKLMTNYHKLKEMLDKANKLPMDCLICGCDITDKTPTMTLIIKINGIGMPLVVHAKCHLYSDFKKLQ